MRSAASAEREERVGQGKSLRIAVDDSCGLQNVRARHYLTEQPLCWEDVSKAMHGGWRPRALDQNPGRLLESLPVAVLPSREARMTDSFNSVRILRAWVDQRLASEHDDVRFEAFANDVVFVLEAST